VKATGDLGKVLVDGRGRTLYMFGRDSAGKSNCTGACAANWPPAGGTPKPGSGVAKGSLKSIKRPDGSRQLAYAGHPLYRFSGDTAAGDTNGEGQNAFGGTWNAVAASGAAAKQAAGSGAATYSGGGY
jgi:predicted lipoprotein with Yx(FWY)xxD motif